MTLVSKNDAILSWEEATVDHADYLRPFGVSQISIQHDGVLMSSSTIHRTPIFFLYFEKKIICSGTARLSRHVLISIKSSFLRPLPANPHRHRRRSSFLFNKKNFGVRRRLKNSEGIVFAGNLPRLWPPKF